ncbi:NAD(P)H-binding protein [Solicola gregarius]|uniref:NAD(P)H-binding protein n=1 Tax=Solicola gregarius TaxID=2908642 RepID=A0AA46TFZ1_9ACTN|nr:NAD(P)H-binding protein [Solicola gregarius]UYM04606.1 NAD(P)H-binding protein [Solicola gregarius]
MRILVAGASGFVGRRLSPVLEESGHEVVALTRTPQEYVGAGVATYGDVHRASSLPAALEGCKAAYYLVHSLDSPDFERLDATAARDFGLAAADAGVGRIVYLGGLGAESEGLSAHLRSRREVEGLLGAGGVPVTTLRAGVIVGAGGSSWELMRQLVARLPAMVTPRWVNTRAQPIGLADVVRYLVGVLDERTDESRTYEIGGPEVLDYLTMLRRIAELERRRQPVVVPVPLLSPRLSSLWLALVTDVDVRTGRNLVDSMVNEVVVEDDSIRAVVPFEPKDFRAAALDALPTARGEPGDYE